MNAKHNPKWTKGHNPRPETLKMLEEKKKEKELPNIEILSEKEFHSSGNNSNN